MSKILTIGSSGLVGQIVSNLLENKYGYNLLTPSHNELDITNKKDIDDFVNNKDIDVVLLLAANTDVDGMEKDGGAVAKKVNIEGSKNVAAASKKYKKHLICFSTDFVFSGTERKKGPYKITDKRESVNSKLVGVYAKTKIAGEEAVEEVGGDNTIIRIAYPFGNSSTERDFAKKTLGILQKGYPLFADQKFSPTYIPDIAEAVDKVIKGKLTGIYHVVCSPVTTPYEFGKYLANKVGLKMDIKKGSLKEFMVGKTPKPLFGGLVPSKELVDRNWKDAVDEFAKKINS